MTFLYSFYTECTIFFAIVYFFVMSLGSRRAWSQELFSRFIYRQLIIMLIIVLFALCISEGHWHFVLQPQLSEDDFPFYPTTFLASSFLGFVSKVTLLILTIACVLLHKPTAALSSRVAIEYSILILFITLASFLLISSTNLAFAFVAMELQTLSLVAFAYIGHQRKTLAAEATFRYFVNAAFASVSFLFSISMLYAITGTLQLEQLTIFFQTQVFTSITSFLVLIVVSAVLLFFAFFFKLTLAPFHHWVGDLYQGTSGYVGSYFTLVTKIPMWVLLTKVMVIFLHPDFSNLIWTFQLIAIASLFIGNVYAFSLHNFRRFWAIGSIGHMGQILLGLLFFGADNIFVASFYLFLYLSANIFFWGLLLHQEARPNFDLKYWEFLRSTFRFFSLHNHKLALVSLFVLVSLAGIPPAFGFAAKLYLFLSLYQVHSFFLLACVFFINLISLSYYLRLIRFLFFQNPIENQSLEEKQIAPWVNSVIWGFVIVFLIHCFFGFWLIQLLFSALVALF